MVSLHTFINLLVVSLILLVVVVLRIFLYIGVSSARLFANGSQDAALLGDEAVLDDLADVLSFRVLSILVALVLFELLVCVFRNFIYHACVRHY